MFTSILDLGLWLSEGDGVRLGSDFLFTIVPYLSRTEISRDPKAYLNTNPQGL